MKRFTISQNVRSYMFDRVLNKSLKLIYFYIMEPLMVKSFKIFAISMNKNNRIVKDFTQIT